jgi:hypothetical protein
VQAESLIVKAVKVYDYEELVGIVKLIAEMVLAVTVATEQLLTKVILNVVEMYYPLATVPVRIASAGNRECLQA